VKKRFLGLPVPIIAVILAVVVASAGVFAGIMLTREIPSHVSIVVPYGLSVWEDEDCTIELTELDFGDIEANGESDYVSFYLKNEGENDSYIAMSQSGLDGDNLALNWEGQDGSCPPDGQVVYYEYIDTGYYLYANIGSDETEIELRPSACADYFTVDNVIRIDDEQMLIVEVGVPNFDYITVVRGYDDTTPADHSANAIVYEKSQPPLAPDAIMNVVLFLSADDQATVKSDVDFTTIINASDIAY
jgi:hypothetical protein